MAYLTNRTQDDPDGRLPQPTIHRERVTTLVGDIQRLAADRLTATDPRRFKDAIDLCKQAQLLQRSVASTVGDVADLDDDEYGDLAGPIRGHRARLGGIGGMADDQAELTRTALAEVRAQSSAASQKNDLKLLELLVTMKRLKLETTEDFKEIYDLVRADVLRGLQSRAEPEAPQQNDPQRDESDGAGEGAADALAGYRGA